MKLAGVVTLYHPNDNIISNIESYIEQLDVLYVLDNTEGAAQNKKQIISLSNKIRYIAFLDNMGIAYAMNFALNLAKANDFILTMDQDSCFAPGMMEYYKRAINEFEMEHPQEVGIYSVNFDQRVDPVIPRHRLINVAITSGSVIPVQAAITIGGFDENLFIDEVDNEFSYRIRKYGFDIVEFPFIILKHTLGKQTFHQILGFHYNTFNHNWLRKYYMTRNRIYVMKKYPNIKVLYIKKIIKDIIKVIIAEHDKKNKIIYIIKGIKDGMLNNMGKLSIINKTE